MWRSYATGGVNLITPQLERVPTARLVTTMVFGSTTSEGLQRAHDGGLAVRVLNPAGGTFHPKLYLARHGNRLVAVVGSANLTTGLIANVESGRSGREVHAGPAHRGACHPDKPQQSPPSNLRRTLSKARRGLDLQRPPTRR